MIHQMTTLTLTTPTGTGLTTAAVAARLQSIDKQLKAARTNRDATDVDPTPASIRCMYLHCLNFNIIFFFIFQIIFLYFTNPNPTVLQPTKSSPSHHVIVKSTCFLLYRLHCHHRWNNFNPISLDYFSHLLLSLVLHRVLLYWKLVKL